MRFAGVSLGKKVDMTVGRRLAAAAVCVPLLVVGGCSDDPKPKVAAPTETRTSASPSATPSPKPWEKKTNAGAVAFARHWVDVFNDAARTGETQDLLTMGAATCDSCTSFAEVIDGIYSAGGEYHGDGWRVEQTSTTRVHSDGTAVVALRIHQSPERITRPGKPVERNEAATVTYSAELDWEAGKWLMSHLYFVS